MNEQADILGGEMQITTLLENHKNFDQPELQAEHGLSFYIEHEGHVYMSDVGQSGKFAYNAVKLGKDLRRVEVLAISHHHYDHGGGLGRFFWENEHATVYLRQSQHGDCVADDGTDQPRFIGLDRKLLLEYEGRIVQISENREVMPGFHLLTDIPRNYPKPSGDQRLRVRVGDELQPDTFDHELVTVIESAQGLVVLTGCAHNGVLNMIAATHKAFPDQPIQAVIGGFHLHHEDEETVSRIGKALLEEGIQIIVTGHCTGDTPVEILEGVLGDRLHRLYSGMVMEF